MEQVQPRVIVSKCLEHEACRYNYQVIPNSFVSKLRQHVEFVAVCPELVIGLGVLRAPIRIVSIGGDLRLLQPAALVRRYRLTFPARYRGDSGRSP